MSITVADTRSYLLVAYNSFTYADFTSGTGEAMFALPQGAIVRGGSLIVDTNWNSGTSAGAEVGDAGSAARYLSSENLLAAGDEYAELVPTGYAVTNANRNLLVEVTETGTAATAGAGRITVEYFEPTQAHENFE